MVAQGKPIANPMRLVNAHTAAIDGVAVGAVGTWDPDSVFVRDLIKARKLIAEGEVLASHATRLVDAPTLRDLATLRADLVRKDAFIKELLAENGSHKAEMKRVEDRFAELATKHATSDALAAENEKLKAEIVELKNLLASATAPAAKPEAKRVAREG